jgi:hypothetical protein
MQEPTLSHSRSCCVCINLGLRKKSSCQVCWRKIEMAMGLSHAPETRYRRRSIRGRPLYEDESERISIMARSQRLQSRPNTLAQTNCHRSFFACNSAADHTSPVTALSLTRPAVARVCSCAHWSDRAHFVVGAGTASVSRAAVHLRHPQLLSPSRSSTRCCPPVISSIINDHDEFFDLPCQGGG